MEVDRSSFAYTLPTILKHISTADYVAFDLELSGIPVRKHHASTGRPKLQERYEEVKRAAETFSILQVGLTCVEQDTENDKYLMRSYNFNLSPLVGDGLDVEREFTYSTGAVEFLLSVGYKMDAPFLNGVPYLTREETVSARKRAIERWDRAAIPDITIRSDDQKALGFMKRVRKEINEWDSLAKHDHVTIGGRLADTGIKLPLNRFEKRLVHQIVRGEYPKLQSTSTQDWVRVDAKNEEEQEQDRAQLHRRLNRAMFDNIGFRWLMEAMAGGDLSGIEPASCGMEIQGEKQFRTMQAFTERLDQIRETLSQKPRVLVGHNCFMDLVFFYRYFYGSLPDTVEEFQEALHSLFPMIVDTKYLSTTGPDAHHFRSSQLSQIEEALANDEKPAFDYPNDHPRYLNSEKYHEAGFDSFVTSKVFLRLASRLNALTSTKSVISSTKETSSTAIEAEEDGFTQAVPKKKRKSPMSESRDSDTSKFSTANMYTALSGELAEKPTSSSSTIKHPSAGPQPPVAPVQALDNMLPSWSSDFWKLHGNKLRVFGTVEEECDLTKKRKVVEEVQEKQKDDEDEGGVELQRRPSILASLQESLQSLWLGGSKK